ncbi:hypothetical protein HOG17_00420 [Candidatus Peregrinibacteria bacterium]|jgi:dolichol kinase|nr:hypothetical protein [Candidatus Peregrinibacteria bacterium]MBT4147724.1 hypothetical protein [Candidatus Peregrinibacteria bacterium]MBT4365802.1 hypothetical protein [Candidatus Peregrinibacteria bacterium]MBT4455731.1 hypothetical protein [Candidatus Peregrinibacteria bacterium]
MDIEIRKKRARVFKELLRKSYHFFAGIAFVVGYSMVSLYVSKDFTLYLLVGILLAIFLFEHLRIEHRPRLLRIVDVLFRKKEYNRPSSMISFVMAGILVFAVFEHWIAFTALMMLTIGDSFSACFGQLFGEKKLRGKKTYVGTFSGLIANLLTGAVLMWEYPIVFIPMALVATFVELMTNKLDDNLTVPIATAFTGYLIVTFLDISLTLS